MLEHYKELEDADYFKQALYKEKCENCGRIHCLKTQRDERPEYYTIVYVVCECDTDVVFRLPVN